MKVALITFGTRGDVQPMVALALGMQRAGHEVFVGAPSNLAWLAEQYGVPFRPLSCDTQEIAERPEMKRVVESGSLLTFARLRLFRRSHPVLDATNADVWEMTEDAEAMVFRAGAPPAAHSIARKRGIPAVEYMVSPLEPTREFPALGAGLRTGGSMFNRLSGEITYRVFWRMFGPSANRFRRDVLDMPAMPFSGPAQEYASLRQPTLYAYSPSVLPRPSDWREDAHVVGYWFLDEPPGWQPSAELCRFLEAGPKPVLIGFGSMPCSNPRETAMIIFEGLRRTGHRAVLQGGWGQLGNGKELPHDVLQIGDVPSNWLFPRVATVVHHGGAGTLGAALRAGVPAVNVPHNFDHPFWSQRACELGVAPKPVLFRHISADFIAAAIDKAMTDTTMQQKAAELGERIRAEDGVGRAVELFGQYVERFQAGCSKALPAGATAARE